MQEYPRSTNSIEVGNVLVIENEYSEDEEYYRLNLKKCIII